MPTPFERPLVHAIPQPVADHTHGPGGALPVTLTSFIGREHEVDALCDLVRHEDVRLITLTGPGGVGKTRLALRVVESIAPDYPDGVWFVSLGPVRDPGLVASTIAQTLGVRETGGRAVEAGVIAFLRGRRALLVIDNFEHVLDVAPLLSELLAACSRLTCIVTSRVVLLLSAEHEFPVQPLDLPTSTGEITAEVAGWSPAARLFVARARAVQPGFALTDTNASDVAAICRYVDGLPLAIELAASRIRHFSPATLLNQLAADRGGSPLEVLTGGPRDAPSRQQTLRDTIAWSYDLLSPDEQAFFTQMAVFTGGFTLEAAEWMDCEGPTRQSRHTAVDLIGSLVDKSLIVRQESVDGETSLSGGRRQTAPEGENRFGMLETIREFGLELLAASGLEAATRDAHAMHMLALAERAEPNLFGPDQRAWLNMLEAEHANLDGALAWFDRGGATRESLRLVKALFFYWWFQGHLAEGREWLDRALENGTDPATSEWCWAAVCGAMMAGVTGDADRVETLSRATKAAADARGDLNIAALAMKSTATAFLLHGDPVAAMAPGATAVALARQGSQGVWLAHVLGEIGVVAADAGDLEQGATLLKEALAIDWTRGDRLMSAVRHSDLGVVAHTSGDEAAAFDHYTESICNFWEAGGIWYLACPLAGLAAIEASRKPRTAARLIGAAEALRERAGQSGWQLERERDERAVERLRTALGDDEYERERSVGWSMPLSEVIAVAETLSSMPETSSGVPVGSGEVLSTREVEVLRLLVDGHTDKEIAELLEIRPRTASKHVENILAKLGVSSRGEASVYAVRHGLA